VQRTATSSLNNSFYITTLFPVCRKFQSSIFQN
jgi:hypothetical protein